MTKIKCTIKKHLGTIYKSGNYEKQANIVSWSGSEPVLDIRKWDISDPENPKPLRGFTATSEEAEQLRQILNDLAWERGD